MNDINENLLEVAKNGDLKAVKKAIANGADVNVTDSVGRTAMILTINTEAGYYIVKFLLEKGADILAKDKSGKNVRDHLIMPEEPPEHHENEYEAWIHCSEHYTYSFLSRAMEEKQNIG